MAAQMDYAGNGRGSNEPQTQRATAGVTVMEISRTAQELLNQATSLRVNLKGSRQEKEPDSLVKGQSPTFIGAFDHILNTLRQAQAELSEVNETLGSL